MASTPPETEAPAAPLAGAAQVAAGLHARRTPLVATPRAGALAGIGDVGRAARRFSALTGLSLSARRAVQSQGTDVDRQPDRVKCFARVPERVHQDPVHSLGNQVGRDLLAKEAQQLPAGQANRDVLQDVWSLGAQSPDLRDQPGSEQPSREPEQPEDGCEQCHAGPSPVNVRPSRQLIGEWCQDVGEHAGHHERRQNVARHPQHGHQRGQR